MAGAELLRSHDLASSPVRDLLTFALTQTLDPKRLCGYEDKPAPVKKQRHGNGSARTGVGTSSESSASNSPPPHGLVANETAAFVAPVSSAVQLLQMPVIVPVQVPVMEDNLMGKKFKAVTKIKTAN
jgi:hypothetical protein